MGEVNVVKLGCWVMTFRARRSLKSTKSVAKESRLDVSVAVVVTGDRRGKSDKDDEVGEALVYCRTSFGDPPVTYPVVVSCSFSSYSCSARLVPHSKTVVLLSSLSACPFVWFGVSVIWLLVLVVVSIVASLACRNAEMPK